ATLVLTRPSAVLFTLPARSLDDIRDAMARGPVEVVAYDQDTRRALATGKLLLVDNIIDQASATIKLKAIFPNDDEKLWPGEFVNAHVLLDTRSAAVVVPSGAVQRGPSGLFVWTVTANNLAEPRPIEVGPAYQDLTVVSSGLSGAWSPPHPSISLSSPRPSAPVRASCPPLNTSSTAPPRSRGARPRRRP